MTDFSDNTAEQRFEQDFEGPDGGTHSVWADYAAQGETRTILHVEAD
ncbi:MAG: N-acetyltransferase, partial [Brevundimonas sp.]